MNRRRYEQLAQGLNSIAMKVLNTVPIREAWSIAQILTELRRLGCALDHRVVSGSLASLEELGLVREQGHKAWIRVQVRDSDTRQCDDQPSKPAFNPPNTKDVAMPKQDKQKPVLDTLADLSSRLRSMAGGMTKLATEIDDAAIAIAEQMQAKDASAAAARQLKKLLSQIED